MFSPRFTAEVTSISNGWRARAIEHCLAQLKANKSPAPFDLDDDGWLPFG